MEFTIFGHTKGSNSSCFFLLFGFGSKNARTDQICFWQDFQSPSKGVSQPFYMIHHMKEHKIIFRLILLSNLLESWLIKRLYQHRRLHWNPSCEWWTILDNNSSVTWWIHVQNNIIHTTMSLYENIDIDIIFIEKELP